jgi:hypothetical protein
LRSSLAIVLGHRAGNDVDVVGNRVLQHLVADRFGVTGQLAYRLGRALVVPGRHQRAIEELREQHHIGLVAGDRVDEILDLT